MLKTLWFYSMRMGSPSQHGSSMVYNGSLNVKEMVIPKLFSSRFMQESFSC
jgi:hypothetical protein